MVRTEHGVGTAALSLTTVYCASTAPPRPPASTVRSPQVCHKNMFTYHTCLSTIPSLHCQAISYENSSIVNHTFVGTKAISSVRVITVSLLSLPPHFQLTKAYFFSDRKCASLATCGEQPSLFFPQTHPSGNPTAQLQSLPSWEFPPGQNSSEPTPCPSHSGSCPVSLANLKPMILDHRCITKEVRAFLVVVVVAAAFLSLSVFFFSPPPSPGGGAQALNTLLNYIPVLLCNLV